jgi:hypothetical protein
MTDEEIRFYEREKSKFDELIKKFGWTEEYLLNEVCVFFSLMGEECLKNKVDSSKK